VDPFVSTIIKQGLVAGALAGLVVFGIFFFVKMAALQNAMLNNIYPPGLDG
jgi:hypothetical protein